MQHLIALSVFLLIVVATAAVGGQFAGGEWYQAMNQPVWNLPALVMAFAWAVVYVLMAVAAWLVWDALRDLMQAALGWWGLQLLLSVIWSWTFFGLHRTGWSLGVMGLWFLVVVITLLAFRSVRSEASRLLLPVAVWLLFVLVLNFTQWSINGGGFGSLI